MIALYHVTCSFAYADMNYNVIVYHREDSGLFHKCALLKGHTSKLTDLLLLPERNRLFSCSRNEIIVWEVSTSSCKKSLLYCICDCTDLDLKRESAVSVIFPFQMEIKAQGCSSNEGVMRKQPIKYANELTGLKVYYCDIRNTLGFKWKRTI